MDDLAERALVGLLRPRLDPARVAAVRACMRRRRPPTGVRGWFEPLALAGLVPAAWADEGGLPWAWGAQADPRAAAAALAASADALDAASHLAQPFYDAMAAWYGSPAPFDAACFEVRPVRGVEAECLDPGAPPGERRLMAASVAHGHARWLLEGGGGARPPGRAAPADALGGVVAREVLEPARLWDELAASGEWRPAEHAARRTGRRAPAAENFFALHAEILSLGLFPLDVDVALGRVCILVPELPLVG